jgi:hypothetical protein
MSDVGSARKAKEQLRAAVGGEPWCVGIGVEREDGVGFVVRITIRPDLDAAGRARIPERLGGVLVKVVEADA